MSLAVGTGVLSNVRVLSQALGVGQNLVQGAATEGLGIQDLVQKSEEGEFGGKDAFAVREGTTAQDQAGVVERGVEFAKERRGGEH